MTEYQDMMRRPKYWLVDELRKMKEKYETKCRVSDQYLTILQKIVDYEFIHGPCASVKLQDIALLAQEVKSDGSSVIRFEE